MSKKVQIGVVTFPGSLDDKDAVRAVHLAGADPVPLWHKSTDLQGVDAVVLPGGFSYGDYLRCGAIASFAPIMKEIKVRAQRGMPVLGICNGFQILTESGLLPGGFLKNRCGSFVCMDVGVQVVQNDSVWSCNFLQGELITLPVKNGEGNYTATQEDLKRIEDLGLVVMRYTSINPNGSLNGICALQNEKRNVLGIMPHPEHASERGFGPDTSVRMRCGVDGLRVFTSAVESILNRVG